MCSRIPSLGGIPWHPPQVAWLTPDVQTGVRLSAGLVSRQSLVPPPWQCLAGLF